MANIEPESTQDNLTPKRLEELTIYIDTIVELNHGQLVMHATLRNPRSWFDDSVAGTFDFEKVRRSVGVPAGCEKELFFFPATSHDPHTILDEEELLGTIQHLYEQSVKKHPVKSISLFIVADIDHVRALWLDQRGKLTFNTIHHAS